VIKVVAEINPGEPRAVETEICQKPDLEDRHPLKLDHEKIGYM
jgi:hypothetical protein